MRDLLVARFVKRQYWKTYFVTGSFAWLQLGGVKFGWCESV